MKDVLPIRSEDKAEEPKESSLSEGPSEDIFVRSIVPKGIPTVGRSIKLRDLFSTSGAVACDSTVVTVTANGSSGAETTMKSFTIFANEWHVGMCIRISAAGLISDTGTGPMCYLGFGSGSPPQTPWVGLQSTAFAAQSAAPWHAEFKGVVTSIGPSGVLETTLRATMNQVNKDNNASAAYAINTTAPLTITFVADWTSSAAGNTVSVRQWLIEILY